MDSHRHLPGVGAHDGHIYVVGGTNDHWEAQSLVESYNPSTNRFELQHYFHVFTNKNLPLLFK